MIINPLENSTRDSTDSLFPNRLSRLPSIFAIAVALAGLALSSAYFPLRSDDAYITFRVARNLADGRGMVYNPGERLQVSSTPLYCLMLAASRALTGCEIGTACRIWEFLFLAADALLLWWIVARSGYARWAWIAPLLFALDPVVTLLSKGMESAMFTAFVLATLAALGSGRLFVASALFAGAVLTRFDGMILGAIVGVATIRHFARAEAPARAWVRTIAVQIALFVVIVAPWFILAGAYFGHPLPVTIAHKMNQVQNMGLSPFGPAFLKSFVWNMRLGIPDFRVAPFLIGAVALMAGRGRRFWLAEWWALYLVVYILAGMPFYLWYQFPLFAPAAGMVAVGFAVLARWAGGAGTIVVRRPVAAVAIALGLGIAAQSVDMARFMVHEAALPRDSLFRDVKCYGAVGEYLRAHSAPDAVVASYEVGLIGYRSGRRILDLAGLTTRLSPSERSRTGLEIVLAFRSDILVMERDVYEGHDAALRERFETAYEIAASFEDPMPQGDSGKGKTILIFSRRDRPEPPPAGTDAGRR